MTSFSWNSSKFLTIVVISTSVVVFLPLFIFDGMKNISSQGIFGETLRTSINLKIAESICIGSTLPMLSDIFLDRISKVRQITGRMNMMQIRTLFLISFSISSAIYLALGDYVFLPFLYICLYRTKLLVVGAVMFSTVSNGSVASAWKLNQFFLFTPVLSACLFNICQVYDIVYPGTYFLVICCAISFYVALISFFSVQIMWFYYLWKQYKRQQRLDNEEITEVVYMTASVFFIVACQVVNSIFGFTLSWFDTGEKVLIGFAVVQILFILISTVLPGRLLRNVAEVQ